MSPLSGLDKIDFSKLRFDYEPFPIGLASGVFSDGFYKELVETFPPRELFKHKTHTKDNQYHFTNTTSRKSCLDWIQRHAAWREFYGAISTRDFAYDVLDLLSQHGIDLGIRRERRSAYRRARQVVGDVIKRHRYPQFERPIFTRFGFFMMPADGGYLSPHTDAASKIVTMVFSMTREGEWDPALGGSLEVVWPKDRTRSFNHVNRFLHFDQVEPLRSYEFRPNQCVVFVKTFNSFHCVRPMHTSGSTLMRKTAIVNIERG